MNNEIYLIIVFVMAMMLGYELIKKIPPTLHTPLMSGTNAISGIVIIGSILVITSSNSLLIIILGFAFSKSIDEVLKWNFYESTYIQKFLIAIPNISSHNNKV